MLCYGLMIAETSANQYSQGSDQNAQHWPEQRHTQTEGFLVSFPGFPVFCSGKQWSITNGRPSANKPRRKLNVIRYLARHVQSQAAAAAAVAELHCSEHAQAAQGTTLCGMCGAEGNWQHSGAAVHQPFLG